MEKIIDADAHMALVDCFDHPDVPRSWSRAYRSRHQHHNFAVTEDWRSMWTRSVSQKIDRQVINHYGLTTGLNYQEHPALAVRLMRIYNDRMVRLCEESDGFFLPVAWLALQDPVACLHEIDRLQDSKIVAFTIDDLIAVGQWEPGRRVIEHITAADRPIYIHFTTNQHWINHRLPGYNGIDPLLSQHIHSTEWSAQCALGKIQWFMEMLAGLVSQSWLHAGAGHRVVLAERGIDWIEQFREFSKAALKVDPLPLFRSKFWFTTEPEHRGFVEDAERLGWDRLLYATDQGHDQGDCGGANAGLDVATIDSLRLTKQQRDQMFFQNFEKCFGYRLS